MSHRNRPIALKGKEIGYYYRSLHAKRRKLINEYKCLITLRIPPIILSNLNKNLQSIENIAKKLNIPIKPTNQNFYIHNECFSDDVSFNSISNSIESNQKDNQLCFPSGYKFNEDFSEDVSFNSRNNSLKFNEKNIKISSIDEQKASQLCSPSGNNLSIKDKIKKEPEELVSIKTEPNDEETTYMDNNFMVSPSTSSAVNNTEINNSCIKTLNIQGVSDYKSNNKDIIINEDFSKDVYFNSSNNSLKFNEKNTKISSIDEHKASQLCSPSGNNLSIKDKIKKEPEELVSIKTEPNDEETTYMDNSFVVSPSTSSAVNTAENNNSPINTLNLQGAGDYKYSYEDIITGTFDEKLEECLSDGITINMNNKRTNDINQSLYDGYLDMLTNSSYKKFLMFREQLPAYKKSKEILEIVNDNQVIVISGETGCGKSTQIPQLLLDDSILNKRGANLKILVTQPRRIAASSLAMRVANERGEKLGESVGYSIRLEKVDCRPCGSILFCTTGILLCDLETNQGLTDYSHIILDEVHERDTHIDLSMCMLKKVLQKRKDLKLILMSATIDPEKLSSYFGECPMLHIEGLAYPVKDVYLEDILMMTKYKLPEQDNRKFRNIKPWQRWKIKKLQANEMAKEIQYKAEISPWLESMKRKLDNNTYKTLQDPRVEELDVNLIFELIYHICKDKPGAILVFLPGIGDITKLLKMITSSSRFPPQQYEVYPLHSKLPSLEQHKIFQTPPNHIRKIIIATNIAETSITIDDIVYVIDCGKIKYSGLNIEENIATLKTEWIAKANLMQRRGRAGRCQPGICYHLITSFRAENLEDRLLPEMQRSDLLEAVLAIKRLRLGKAIEAMNLMPAVPAESTINNAVRRLQQCGALEGRERLTALGWHMARLPVPPAAGKLLLLAALFGCLDRAASVAAVLAFKDPFHMVIGKEREVDAAKCKFALGEPSDHVAISEAIMQWEACSNHEKYAFTYENFLSMNTLQLLSEMKKQFAVNLKHMGFLKSGNITSRWENRNSNNLSLFKAIIAASLYPNIGNVRWKTHKKKGFTQLKVTTPEEGKINLHPSSIMSKVNSSGVKSGANWLVYTMKQRSSDLFLFEVTMVYTLPLLFFGELNVIKAENPEDCLISIKTINVKCNKKTTALLFQMRSLLDQVLASKITMSNNDAANSQFEEEVLNAVIQLITAEDEGVEYLDDEDD